MADAAEPRPSVLGEWRLYWTLPLAAMLGYSTIGLQNFAIGPYVVPLEQEFGWSRAEVMLGLSVSSFCGIFLNVTIGLIVDRFGPRRVGLAGLFVKAGAFGLLATATGSLLNWSMLWVLVAVGVVLVQSTVWTSAVASRFDRSRGLAMSIALSGSAIAAAVAPVLATWLIGRFGWRISFAGVGATWLLVTVPVVFFFFHGRRRDAPADPGNPAPAVEAQGLSLAAGIRTRAFAGLLVSFGAFSFYSMAVSTNLVPLLSETGLGAMEAAGIAAIMGITGFAARLGVGFLLDRYPANVIGAITQLLPVAGCALFLIEAPGPLLLSLAVVSFGVATGAEMDVAIYLATRHFGLRSFASLFGAIIGFGALIATISPLAAGWAHDLTGNYDPMLIGVMLAMIVGSMGVASVGRGPGLYAHAH